jgi:aldose sugar dehydrogenase
VKWLSLLIPATALTFACVTSPESSSEGAVAGGERVVLAQQGRQTMSMGRLWAEHCSRCHGDRGQGGGAGTRTLLTKELFDQKHDRRFFDAIKHGVPDMGMEPFGGVLSDEEMWGLVVHIRERQHQALRAAGNAPKPTEAGTYKSQHHTFAVEDVFDTGTELNTPWAIDWLPDGSAIVTNRGGTMYVAQGKSLGAPVEGMPAVREIGQGGLMDVAVHPAYAKNGWIYLGFTDPSPTNARAGMTKIVRGKIKREGGKTTWTEQQTIFEAPAETYTTAGVHFGCRIVFDGKGHIFFSIGDRGQQKFAQDLSRPNGKILRVREDGSIPSDNPFVKTEGAMPAVWSYGHRNPQGLVFDLEGNLWDTEHAPRGGDEVNRVLRAANYGWPLVSFGINYNDSPFATPWPTAEQKIVQPVFRWMPSTGACGLDVARGKAFPRWKGDLLAGGLSGQNVDRLRIKDDQIVEREELIFNLGRVRDVAVGPDGFVYVVLNGPDKVIRLVPKG